MNNKIIFALIILSLTIGALAGYYYAMSKVDQGLSGEALNQINPFSENNINTNPYEYVNPFE